MRVCSSCLGVVQGLLIYDLACVGHVQYFFLRHLTTYQGPIRHILATPAVYTTRTFSLPTKEGVENMADHNLVSRSGCHRMLMRVSDMGVLGADEERMCPIQMEDFDRACLDFLEPGTCFVEERPELCVGTLPCGHRFCPAAIVYHMCISGMQCPVCRFSPCPSICVLLFLP